MLAPRPADKQNGCGLAGRDMTHQDLGVALPLGLEGRVTLHEATGRGREGPGGQESSAGDDGGHGCGWAGCRSWIDGRLSRRVLALFLMFQSKSCTQSSLSR